uniref:Uncharacterized protein n=1 Tax=Arundo donax TaxID=35708 RepID=A0A0A8ZCK5_ARUDO
MLKNTHLFVDLSKTWPYPYGNWPIQPGPGRDYLNRTVILQIIHSNISVIILVAH